MRNPPAAEIFNEEVSNLLKRKIKSTVTRLDELSIAFDYEGEVTAQDAEEILDKIAALHGRALEAAETATEPGAGRGAAAVRRQPGEGVLRLRARLLPAEPAADRGRRHQRHQGLDRAVADAGGDLLLPEEPQGPAAGPGQEPEEIESTRGVVIAWPTAPTPRRHRGFLIMRIAQVAPLYESVPPKLYGGTERVVSYLTEELVRLGHEVTLFASGDSQTQREAGPGLPAGPVARPGLPGDAAAPRPADGAGLRGRLALRRHPLPLRLPALPAAAPPPVPERHDAARPAARPGPQAAVRGVRRGAAGLDLRRPAPADPAGQLAGDRLPRPAAEPAHLPRASRATTSPSSAASLPRSGWTGPSRSPAGRA